MPTFEVKTPVGANQIWMRQQIREAVAEATRRGKLRPELGRLDHRRELRRQPRARARRSSISISGKRDDDRGQADPQGRRLREHERAVLAAGGARRISAAPIARSKACASASCTRCGRRRARAARRARSASASAAIARPATCTRRSSCSARSTTSIPIRGWRSSKPSIMDDGQQARRSGRWASAASVTLIGCKIGALNRLPASFFVSVAYDCWAFRRLGVVLDAATGAIDAWLYRDPAHPIDPDARSGAGFPRTGREVALQAPLTEEQVRVAQGRRRGADLRARCSPAATPCTRT